MLKCHRHQCSGNLIFKIVAKKCFLSAVHHISFVYESSLAWKWSLDFFLYLFLSWTFKMEGFILTKFFGIHWNVLDLFGGQTAKALLLLFCPLWLLGLSLIFCWELGIFPGRVWHGHDVTRVFHLDQIVHSLWKGPALCLGQSEVKVPWCQRYRSK